MPVEEIERGNMLSSFIATVDTQIEQSQFGHTVSTIIKDQVYNPPVTDLVLVRPPLPTEEKSLNWWRQLTKILYVLDIF